MSVAREPLDVSALPIVGVVEDDPELAAMAAELCRGIGASASLFRAPTPFLEAYREKPPRAVVLDWRLERDVGAGAFLAIRHRFPRLRVVCWTGWPLARLPEMLLLDPCTRVVGKAAGPEAFEEAVIWALGAS